MDPSETSYRSPWMVAAWPGMGSVAASACYYLMAKLGMTQIAELPPEDFFDLDHVDVEGGVIRPGRLPRSRFFSWRDPQRNHDLVVFLGEAQPPAGRRAFCQRVVAQAKDLGVEKIFTFAAMATDMHPQHEARVFGAAIDRATLGEMERLELNVLGEGRIGGLNGVLLGAAGEAGLPGGCLLGEMPHVFAQLPFPKASLAVLEAFAAMMRIRLDLGALAKQAKRTEEELGALLERIQQTIESREAESAEAEWAPEFEAPVAAGEASLSAEDRDRLENLFRLASGDRAKAYDLKAELDRLGVFSEYEDRFLELFR